MLSKKNYKNLIIGFLFIMFFGIKVNSVVAKEMQPCEFSDEYKKWLSLSDEEKNKVIEPSMCKVDPEVAFFNEIMINSNLKSEDIPSSYDILNKYDKVYDQGNTGTCWAFSAISTVESNLMFKGNSYMALSPYHMEYATSTTFLNDKVNPNHFDRELDDGGSFLTATGYLMSGMGPVLNSDFQVTNIEDKEATLEKIELSKIDVPAVVDINDIMYIDYLENCINASSAIKEHLLNSGAVSASIYYDKTYFNDEKAAYYYGGNELVNHSITIVGWDDNYSKDNFGENKPSKDGAWKVLNSYGNSFGENGYFYVSYEDFNVCQYIGGIRNSDTEFTDHAYLYDYENMNMSWGTGSSVSYGANVFTKEGKREILKEIKVGSLAQTDLEAYVIDGVNEDLSNLSVSNATKVAEGTINGGGYITLKLDNPYIIENDKFAIIIKYTSVLNSEKNYPVGTLTLYNKTTNVKVKPGISFLSGNGEEFHDMYEAVIPVEQDGQKVYEDAKSIISIKAYTDDFNYSITSSKENLDEYKYDNLNGGIITIPLKTVNIANDEKLNMHIFNEKDEDVTDSFNVDLTSVKDNNATATIAIPKKEVIAPGNYKVKVSYNDFTIELLFNVKLYQSIEVEKLNNNGYTFPEVIYDNQSYTLNFKIKTINVPDDTPFEYIFEPKLISANGDPLASTRETTRINNNEGILSVLIEANQNRAVDYVLTVNIGDLTATTEFKITEYVPLTINFDKDVYIINKGESLQLQPILNENATNMNIKWEIVNPDTEVATIDEGLVEALESGEATVKAIALENEENIKEVTVKVIESDININDGSIVKTSNALFNENVLYDTLGGKIAFNISKNDVNEVTYRVLNSKLQPVDIFNEFVVNEDNIELTYDNVRYGKYYIEATGKYIVDDVIYSEVVDMYEFTIEKYIPVTGIEAENVNFVIAGGNQYILNYKVLPENATNKEIKVSSSLSEDSGATIIKGNNNITIAYDGTNSLTFNLEMTSLDNSSISKRIEVKIKKKDPFVLTNKNISNLAYTNKDTTLTYGIETNGIDYSNIAVTFVNSSDTIVDTITSSINDGVLSVAVPSGLDPGTYKMKVSADTFTTTEEFIVTAYKDLNKIEFNPSSYILQKGKELLLEPIIPDGTSKSQITWKSSNEDVVSVDDRGNLTANGVGDAYITVTSKDKPIQARVTYLGGLKNSKPVVDGNIVTFDNDEVIFYVKDESVGRMTHGNRIGIKIEAPENLTYEQYKDAPIYKVNEYYSGEKKVFVTTTFDRVKDSLTHYEAWPVVEPGLRSHEIKIQWTPDNVQVIKLVFGENLTLEPEHTNLPPNGTYPVYDEVVFNGNGINFETFVDVKVVDPAIEIIEDQAELISLAPFKDAVGHENTLYELLGGKIKLPLNMRDITDKGVLVYTEFGELVNSDISVDKDDASVTLTYGNTLPAGRYYAVVTGKYEEGSTLIEVSSDKFYFDINEFIPVTSIDAENISLFINETAELDYVVNPSNATYGNIKINIANPDIIEIDENNVITPKKVGTTDVTLSVMDGSSVSDVTISVEVKKLIPTIEIVPESIPDVIYNSKNIDMNFVIKTTNVADGIIPSYKAIDENLREPYKTNVVNNAITDGEAELSFTLAKNITPGTYKLQITIDDVTEEYEFEITQYMPLNLGFKDTYVLLLEDGSYQFYYDISNATADDIKWETSDPLIASVDDTGLVTALSIGEVTISAIANGFPEDRTDIKFIIIDTSLVIDKENVQITSNAPFSEDKLYTTFGGKIELPVELASVNDQHYQIIDEKGQIVAQDGASGFTVTPTIDGEVFKYVVNYDANAVAGKYKIVITGNYKLDDVIYDTTSDYYEFEILEYIPVTSIEYNDITLNIDEVRTLENLVEPANATYKDLKFELEENEFVSFDEETKVLKGLKPGIAVLKITSLDKSEVTKSIKVIVLEEDIFKDTGYVLEEELVYNVQPQTDITEFVNSLNLNPNAIVKLLDKDGNEKTNGFVATGDKLYYKSTTTEITYTFVIRGDVYGDGRITALDYIDVRNHMMGNQLEGVYKLAADANSDSSISALDYIEIRIIIMGGTR